MATTTSKIQYGRKQVEVQGDLIRLGSRAKLLPVSGVYAALPKGERRRLRKLLFRAGFRRAASAPTLVG